MIPTKKISKINNNTNSNNSNNNDDDHCNNKKSIKSIYNKINNQLIRRMTMILVIKMYW